MPNEVDELFDEIKKYKNKCKFKNCLHINEENCNVLANINEIDISRYQSYIAFAQEAKEFKDKVKFQGTKKETALKETLNKKIVKIDTNKRRGSRKTQKQNLYKDLDNVE